MRILWFHRGVHDVLMLIHTYMYIVYTRIVIFALFKQAKLIFAYMSEQTVLILQFTPILHIQ